MENVKGGIQVMIFTRNTSMTGGVRSTITGSECTTNDRPAAFVATTVLYRVVPCCTIRPEMLTDEEVPVDV